MTWGLKIAVPAPSWCLHACTQMPQHTAQGHQHPDLCTHVYRHVHNVPAHRQAQPRAHAGLGMDVCQPMYRLWYTRAHVLTHRTDAGLSQHCRSPRNYSHNHDHRCGCVPTGLCDKAKGDQGELPKWVGSSKTRHPCAGGDRARRQEARQLTWNHKSRQPVCGQVFVQIKAGLEITSSEAIVYMWSDGFVLHGPLRSSSLSGKGAPSCR